MTVAVEGPGVLAGFGSAAPATEESYVDDVHTTYDGRALAVVRPTGSGTITVTATADGCDPVSVSLDARRTCAGGSSAPAVWDDIRRVTCT